MPRITLLLPCLLALSCHRAQPRTATIRLSLSHTTATACQLLIPDSSLVSDYFKKGQQAIPLDAKGSGSLTLQLDRPQFVWLCYMESDSGQNHVYTLWLSPGDSLRFEADCALPDDGIRVTGQGAKNNQPMIGRLPPYPETHDLSAGDTLPASAIAMLVHQKRGEDSALKAYIAEYHPSPDFVKAWSENIDYMALWGYISYRGNNKYSIWAAYQRHLAEWEHVQDSLLACYPLNNREALVAPSYQKLIGEFLSRTKEELWQEANDHPAAFYREWYDTTQKAGMDLFTADVQNLLQEKIILRYFKEPAAAEYAYAVLMEDALSESNPNNLVPIYDRFKKRFPQSVYRPWFDSVMTTVADRMNSSLNSGIVFAPDGGANLHTWEDLLALVKGKTVLLDMWGTWCSPCREQLDQHAKALHDYFRGKGLVFLYVANHDETHKDLWKNLIGYFNLEGTHVLAGEDLTGDIMKKVHGGGFPTYVVIKKDGTFALSAGGYPMNRELLIKQLEDALRGN